MFRYYNEKREGVVVFLIAILYKNNWFIILITFLFMISRSNEIIVAVEGCYFPDSGSY